MTQLRSLLDSRSTGETCAASLIGAIMLDQPSLDELIMGHLTQRGYQPLEQLVSPLPQVNWSELFLAINRLVRSGRICLWPATTGDIVLSLTPNTVAPEFASAR
jgi:hypothetical protein